MGVKWGPNFIWALIFTKFGGKECFCKLLKALTLDLQFFDFESPIWSPLDPQKGSNGGQIGFKLYLSSDLHHIWTFKTFVLCEFELCIFNVVKDLLLVAERLLTTKFGWYWSPNQFWPPFDPPDPFMGSNGGLKVEKSRISCDTL